MKSRNDINKETKLRKSRKRRIQSQFVVHEGDLLKKELEKREVALEISEAVQEIEGVVQETDETALEIEKQESLQYAETTAALERLQHLAGIVQEAVIEGHHLDVTVQFLETETNDRQSEENALHLEIELENRQLVESIEVDRKNLLYVETVHCQKENVHRHRRRIARCQRVETKRHFQYL